MRCVVCATIYDALRPGMDPALCPRCVGAAKSRSDPVAMVPAAPADFVAVEVSDDAADALADLVECPECAETIKARARSCRYCGFDLARGRPPAAPSRAPATFVARGGVQHVVMHVPKSSGVAVVLSFVYPGLGQMYCGRIGKGLAVMFAPLVLVLLWLLGLFSVSRNGRGPSDGALAGGYLAVLLASLLFWCWQLFDAYASAMQANRGMGLGPQRRRRRRR